MINSVRKSRISTKTTQNSNLEKSTSVQTDTACTDVSAPRAVSGGVLGTAAEWSTVFVFMDLSGVEERTGPLVEPDTTVRKEPIGGIY